MKGFLYAAYDLKTEAELCLGVWDSITELSGAMKISPKAAYCNLYRTRVGRKYTKSGLAIHRIPTAIPEN